MNDPIDLLENGQPYKGWRVRSTGPFIRGGIYEGWRITIEWDSPEHTLISSKSGDLQAENRRALADAVRLIDELTAEGGNDAS